MDATRHLQPGQQPTADSELLLLPIASGDRLALASLARELSSTGFTVSIAPQQNVDPNALTAARNQYRADRVLGQARRAATGRVLVVTDVDLYAPGLNFVFGMAVGDAAVVSVHRLRAGADATLLEQRLLKEARHELGHTFGLGHCSDPHCVMSFSNSVADVDRKTPRFCHACQGRLNWR